MLKAKSGFVVDFLSQRAREKGEREHQWWSELREGAAVLFSDSFIVVTF